MVFEGKTPSCYRQEQIEIGLVFSLTTKVLILSPIAPDVSRHFARVSPVGR